MTAFPPLPRRGLVAVWHYQGESGSRAGLWLLEPDERLLLTTSGDFPGDRTNIGYFDAGTVLTFAAFETTLPDLLLRSDDDRQAALSGSWSTEVRIDWETIPFGTPGYDGDLNDQVTRVSLVVAGGFEVGKVAVG